MIDGRNAFDQLVKIDLRTHDNIRKITICQGAIYSTVCLLNYHQFIEHYRTIAINLSKQQTAIQIKKQQSKLILLEI